MSSRLLCNKLERAWISQTIQLYVSGTVAFIAWLFYTWACLVQSPAWAVWRSVLGCLFGLGTLWLTFAVLRRKRTERKIRGW
ncbi:hypothetical protein [Nocardia jiangxiensis]|uniref:hypothetical protein n=1 Tax=Nocardia jiangxiensis TaxID=282685 RepID=UPI000592BD2A|nr:hypothetical protein [Nocardia jiangxiensis]